MNKRNFAMIGMIVSLVMALCGLLTIFGAFGGDGDYPSSASYGYDSGFASFGADFYSYVNNNAATAANGAQAAARSLDSLADLFKTVCGIMLIGCGLLGFSGFGIIWSGTEKPQKANIPSPAVEETATEEMVEIEEPVFSEAEEKETLDPEKLNNIFGEEVDVEITNEENA